MSSIRAFITEETGCETEDAPMIECIMRQDVFHSTLDWQTEEELRHGARVASALLRENRDLYEQERELTKAIFKEMKSSVGKKMGPKS